MNPAGAAVEVGGRSGERRYRRLCAEWTSRSLFVLPRKMPLLGQDPQYSRVAAVNFASGTSWVRAPHRHPLFVI